MHAHQNRQKRLFLCSCMAASAICVLTSGTFLYVALNEVISKELEHPDGHRLAKVAALLLGFGLMSLLAVWA